MNFVSAKCPQCGGALQVPDDCNSVKCMYCGTDIVVREAINLASGNLDNYMELGKSAQDAGNYSESYDYFTKALELDPKNSEAWAGKALSAGWQSNLIKNRLDEMLVCYEKAVNTSINEGLKEVIKLQAAVSILSVSKAFFNMSTEHTIEFVGVASAKFEHVDRCKDIIRACEKAYAYDSDLDEIPNFIVDICNRITRLSGIVSGDKSFFESAKNKYVNSATSAQVINSAKSSSNCFVVTATMGDDQNKIVLLMRTFRDNVLRKFLFGRIFISWYYINGPKFADSIRHSFFKRALSFLLIVLPSAILAGIYLLVTNKFRRDH